ncbi:MAG TPA: DeoR/GlpR family DNA-binding transcription regulator [Sphingomonas sp.]
MSTKDVTPPAPPRKRSGQSALLPEVRRRRILEWLQKVGNARVRDLSDAFEVSEVTIRQDLERLELEGQIAREHGGAYLKSVTHQVQSLSLHHLVNMEAKRAIGRAAARSVRDGETIILDSGSTTTEVAANLTDRENLTVITNAINIALMLGALPSMTVHMPGGQFKAPTLSLTGEKSADYFEGIFAETLFLATAAISFEAGLTFPAIADIHVKRRMIQSASRVHLVADSSKIGRTSFSSLGPIEIVHTFITDSGIRDEDRHAFEKAGLTVLVAN